MVAVPIFTKKILIFNSGSLLYGSERGLVNLVRALNDKYDVTVVLPGRGPLVKLLEEKGAKVRIFPLSVLAFSFSPLYYMRYFFLFVINIAYFSAYAFFRKIDIIYSNNALLLFPCLAARLSGKKHVWHLREFFHSRRVNKFIAVLARRFSSGIICQSKNIKDVLFPGRDDEKIKVIYEGLNPDQYKRGTDLDWRRRLSIPKETVLLSIVSRIHPLKGQYEFIKSMAPFFKETERKAVLVIAGDISPRTLRNRIYKKRIEALIRGEKLEDRALLLGFREDIADILLASDICVFPFKRNEPFGLALLEALAFSKEVFLNFNPGSKEITAFFGDNCRELNPELLIETIQKRNFKKRKTDLPDVFLFENYKRRMLSFMKGIF